VLVAFSIWTIFVRHLSKASVMQLDCGSLVHNQATSWGMDRCS
jgi:hypothetical protein